MTERNIYKHDVDFAALALQSPAFNKFLKVNGQLDFSNPDAVQWVMKDLATHPKLIRDRQLTKSLLERDFGLHIDLPGDRLCPPVPNRLNYILWIQDLLDSTSDNYTEQYDADRKVTGFDIGTGAGCIYPLLGCSQRPSWRFAATDIDGKNMESAKQNIIKNNLKSRIRPLQTWPTDPLISLQTLGLERIDFTMCNPPFYSSSADLQASAASKSCPPHSACTGADVEMVTPGGEVSFVSRMIQESQTLGERCQWYTSMLGKASSIETIVQRLKDANVENWAVKDLVQGGKTKRWVVGWSWGSLRPSDEVARGTTTLPKHLLPFPSEYHFDLQSTLDTRTSCLNSVMQALDVQWRYRPSLATGIVFAKGNVWSRATRRSKQQHQGDSHMLSEDQRDDEHQDPALAVKVRLVVKQQDMVNVRLRWLQGRDSVLFESFCGMLKRQLIEHT